MKIARVLRMLVAGVVLVAGQASATVTYHHNDLLGSPVAATDENRAIVWKESYRPYGERIVNDPASTANSIYFTGRRQDPGSGLVYMGARYYDPVIGRFVSTDPVQFKDSAVHTFNRYAYAYNNPFRFYDPDGREVRIVGHLAAGFLGQITNPNSYHTAIFMKADDGSYAPMTVGGQPDGGKLVSSFNLPGDSLAAAAFSQVVPTPKGMTDSQFIDSIVQAARRHDDATAYSFPEISLVPGRVDGQMKPGTYNSNSYVAGVLDAAGAGAVKLAVPAGGQAPGFSNPLPIRR